MSDNQPSGMAVGFTAFAGVMMIMVGFFQSVAGFGAILKDQVYVVGVGAEDYVFSFDATTWGWIHLLIGLTLLLAGFGVFSGNVLARSVGVLIAGVSAIANFVFLFGWNQPLWSILIITVDIIIIWALTVHGREIAQG